MKRKNRKKRRMHCNRTLIWSLVFAGIAAAGLFTAGTIAYLQSNAALVNHFETGQIEASVQETFENNEKSDVTIKNEGNSDAYVRAKILVYLEDKDGNVIGTFPEAGTDYEMTMGDMAGFIQTADGYYYYKKPVAAEGSTSVLIRKCTSNIDKPGQYLVVDILGEAIQADAEAVKEAWGADVEVGTDKNLVAVQNQQENLAVVSGEGR